MQNPAHGNPSGSAPVGVSSSGASSRELELRTYVSPQDLNRHGVVFGPVILEGADVTAGQHVCRYLSTTALTRKLEIEFLQPGLLADRLSFYVDGMAVGRTSATLKISVEADRVLADSSTVTLLIAKGIAVMVNVGPKGQAVPWPQRPGTP